MVGRVGAFVYVRVVGFPSIVCVLVLCVGNWVCLSGPRGPEILVPPGVSHTPVLLEAAMVREGLGGSWGSH